MGSDNEEDQAPNALGPRIAPSFEGMWRYLKGRLGRPRSPRHDPAKSPVQFRPCFRVKTWDGLPEGHCEGGCGPPPVCSHPGEYGQHSEVVPDGFDWEGVHFHGLYEALENQAFQRWYEDVGSEILSQGKLVARPPLSHGQGQQPLPRYNFFLHENIEKMTNQEIVAYRQTGEVPKRLRRRGRNKPKSDALEE